MEKIKISVITISYNAANEIEYTIRSVLSQDYDNMEYIIVDGASNDNTLHIAKKVISEFPTKKTIIISEPDKGLYDAMNKGINVATGNWCSFMNCGDIFNNNRVLSGVFEGNSSIEGKKIIYGNCLYEYKNGETKLHNTPLLVDFSKDIIKKQPYCHQAAFFNLEDKNLCLYNCDYRIAADYDVCCRCYKKYGVSAFLFIPLIICRYKAYDGVSSNESLSWLLQKEQLLIKIRNGISISYSIKCMIHNFLQKRFR